MGDHIARGCYKRIRMNIYPFHDLGMGSVYTSQAKS